VQYPPGKSQSLFRLIKNNKGSTIMVKYTISTISCPNCGRKLGWGFRRFGPAQVHCGHCGTVLQTGLPDWYDPFPFLGQGGRLGMVIREILTPSWIGVSGFMGFVFNLFIVLPLVTMVTGLVGMAPFFVAMALVPPGGDSPGTVLSAIAMVLMVIGTVTATLGVFAYPLLLVVRLVRMVRESRAYMHTHEPPVWGKRVWGKGATKENYDG